MMSQFAQTAREAIDDLVQQIEQQDEEHEHNMRLITALQGAIKAKTAEIEARDAELVEKDAKIEEMSRHIAMLEVCVDRLDKTAETLMERV